MLLPRCAPYQGTPPRRGRGPLFRLGRGRGLPCHEDAASLPARKGEGRCQAAGFSAAAFVLLQKLLMISSTHATTRQTVQPTTT